MLTNFSIKQIIIFITAIVGAILLLISQTGLYAHSNIIQGQPLFGAAGPTPSPLSSSSDQEITLVSTEPSPLDSTVIPPTQTLTFTFSAPVENGPEFKHRIEPEVDLEVKLSDDHKTVTITAPKGFGVGMDYTLFIQSDAKFQAGKTLGKDYIFHFKTISYNGV